MRVLFFAQIKDATGCATAELKLASPLNQDELWAALLKRFPELGLHRAHTRLARNGEYINGETWFIDGDEAALIPPVSGG